MIAAARYVELNPVRAGLAPHPDAWPWSSAKAHLRRRDDVLVRARPLLDLVPDWPGLLADDDPAPAAALRRHSRTGRPLGDDAFLDRLEVSLGRRLRPAKPGPKPRTAPRSG